MSLETLLCLTGILSADYCALQVSQQRCQQERKRVAALYIIYVSQNCLFRDNPMVRKEAKSRFVGFQQQKALSDSFHCRETSVAMLLLLSIYMFKNLSFSISNISISIIVSLSAWFAVHLLVFQNELHIK